MPERVHRHRIGIEPDLGDDLAQIGVYGRNNDAME
jgi:hypothetical protein